MSWQAWNPFLRFPRAALLVTAILCLPLLTSLRRFELSSETRTLLQGDQRNLASYDRVREILADVEVVVISLECPDVFSPAGLDAVGRVSNAFAAQPGVVDVKSLTHSVKPVRRGIAFEMVPLVPEGEFQPAALAQLRAYCLAHPLIRNVMVAADSRHTILLVSYRPDISETRLQRHLREQVMRTLEPFRREGLRFEVLALALIGEEIQSTLLRDLRTFLPITLLFVLLILRLTFRSWTVVALVLVNLGALFLVLPGLIVLCGFRLNVYSTMLFPLLAGMHLAQLAHVYTAYPKARSRHADVATAVQATLDDVFKSCGFSLLTSAIGLLSLATSDVPPVREFGLLGAVGIATVFVLTFGPGLSLLIWVGRAGTLAPARQPTGPPVDQRWAGWLAAAAERHCAVTLLCAGAAIAIAWQGFGLLRTDIRAAEFLNRDSPTRRAIEAMDRVYGGINVVQIEFATGAANGINDLAFLRYLEQVERYARSRSGVSGAYSYAQLLAMINQVWESDRPEALRLPDNPWLVTLFVTALKSYDFPFLTTLADRDFRTASLVVRTQDMPSDPYLALIQDVVSFAQRGKPAKVTVSAAEGIHSILEADRRIIRSQMRSAGLTSLVIALVLTVLWRSAWLSLASVLTNAIPVGLVIAMAGFLDIPLNSITVMVAAISLGIVVDDSIHFITYWREQRRSGRAPAEALQRALEAKVWPIVWTSIIMIGVASVFWFSSFPPVVHFGGLSAFAFTMALVSVLLFLPALLRLSSRRAPPRSETTKSVDHTPPGPETPSGSEIRGDTGGPRP